MVRFELGDESDLLNFDTLAAPREFDYETIRHARHLPLERAAVTSRPGVKVPAELLAKQVGEDALVEFGEFDGRSEDGAAIEGAPEAVARTLGAVEDDHVVVELGVARARVEVGKGRRDDAVGLVHDYPVGAGTHPKDLALGVVQDVANHLLVAPVDHVAGGVDPSPVGSR